MVRFDLHGVAFRSADSKHVYKVCRFEQVMLKTSYDCLGASLYGFAPRLHPRFSYSSPFIDFRCISVLGLTHTGQ